jgi:hypothetical protein
LLVPTLSGCAHAKAAAAIDLPPLDVPAPPPRIVEPIAMDAPPPVPLVDEPARQTPPRPPARPPARTDVRPEAAKPPTETAEAPKPAEAAEPPKTPPTTLQTTPTVAEGELERSIRAQIARANADLNRVDYRALNADARMQYDTAKRFVRQAEDALRVKNVVFAQGLAEKAAALAAQLGGR